MSISPFDPTRFVKENTCLPCCTPVTPVCPCFLFIPGFVAATVGTPTYSSLAIAESHLNGTVTGGINNSKAVDCFAFLEGNPSCAFSADSVDLSVVNQATITAAVTSGGASNVDFQTAFSINLLSGATVTVASSFTFPMVSDSVYLIILFDCFGNVLDVWVDSPGVTSPHSFSPSLITADGTYVVLVQAVSDSGAASGTGTVTVSSDSTMTVNPVIAQWDDSGTTRQAWACPKLLLPPLTESSGTWYASCADAESDISASVSNCVGYSQAGPGVASFTATDGGATLTLTQTFFPPSSSFPTAYGGVNAVGGQTLSVAFSASGGTPAANIGIYDDDGNLVEGAGPVTSSPWTSSPLPYTGRYTVQVFMTDTSSPPPTWTTASVVISSSGAMSVNPVQARYNAGLTCPGLLDCGNTCP